MTTEKLHFTKERESMLMMLNGKAIQSQWEHPILRDPGLKKPRGILITT